MIHGCHVYPIGRLRILTIVQSLPSRRSYNRVECHKQSCTSTAQASLTSMCISYMLGTKSSHLPQHIPDTALLLPSASLPGLHKPRGQPQPRTPRNLQVVELHAAKLQSGEAFLLTWRLSSHPPAKPKPQMPESTGVQNWVSARSFVGFEIVVVRMAAVRVLACMYCRAYDVATCFSPRLSWLLSAGWSARSMLMAGV